MATQPANLQSSHHHPTYKLHHSTRRKLLRKAEHLFEMIGCYGSDSCTVEEFRILRDYLNEFLALPPDILAEWEKL